MSYSASSKFPDGLANSSGQVGRNYMRHMTGSVYAVFDKPVNMYRGTTMAGIITDESGHDTSRGFAGGYDPQAYDDVYDLDRGQVITLETLADGIGILLRTAGLYETLEKTNARLVELDRTKSELVNVVAHDFRTPLAAILGWAEMLEARPGAEENEIPTRSARNGSSEEVSVSIAIISAARSSASTSASPRRCSS